MLILVHVRNKEFMVGCLVTQNTKTKNWYFQNNLTVSQFCLPHSIVSCVHYAECWDMVDMSSPGWELHGEIGLEVAVTPGRK